MQGCYLRSAGSEPIAALSTISTRILRVTPVREQEVRAPWLEVLRHVMLECRTPRVNEPLRVWINSIVRLLGRARASVISCHPDSSLARSTRALILVQRVRSSTISHRLH